MQEITFTETAEGQRNLYYNEAQETNLTKEVKRLVSETELNIIKVMGTKKVKKLIDGVLDFNKLSI